MSMTLHQIRIFWSVAQAQSYTKASKLLGLAQPSLSQQITKLEEEQGAKLFNRGHSKVTLTNAGEFLYAKAEVIMASVEEAQSGLQEFSKKTRGVISVGILGSVARNILPRAMIDLHKTNPNIDIDVIEVAPAEAIDLLYARQLSLAILAADSVAGLNASFDQSNIYTDSYVLATPKSLRLDNIELDKNLKKILNSAIIFEYGSQQKKKIDVWLDKYIPSRRVIAHTRSYEVALSIVEAGLGITIIPSLAASIGSKKSYEVNLYETELPARRLKSFIPTQNKRIEPYKTFISCLEKSGKTISKPKTLPLPTLLTKIKTK